MLDRDRPGATAPSQAAVGEGTRQSRAERARRRSDGASPIHSGEPVMIPDVLQMLRDANPVTEPVSYPDERVPTEIAQITEAGPERVPIAAGPGIDLAPRRPRWPSQPRSFSPATATGRRVRRSATSSAA